MCFLTLLCTEARSSLCDIGISLLASIVSYNVPLGDTPKQVKKNLASTATHQQQTPRHSNNRHRSTSAGLYLIIWCISSDSQSRTPFTSIHTVRRLAVNLLIAQSSQQQTPQNICCIVSITSNVLQYLLLMCRGVCSWCVAVIAINK